MGIRKAMSATWATLRRSIGEDAASDLSALWAELAALPAAER